jgi:hypothetical protein
MSAATNSVITTVHVAQDVHSAARRKERSSSGVELAANRSHLLIAKLPEERGGLVVFKGRASRRVLVLLLPSADSTLSPEMRRPPHEFSRSSHLRVFLVGTTCATDSSLS